jgi:hypothetical protein
MVFIFVVLILLGETVAQHPFYKMDERGLVRNQPPIENIWDEVTSTMFQEEQALLFFDSPWCMYRSLYPPLLQSFHDESRNIGLELPVFVVEHGGWFPENQQFLDWWKSENNLSATITKYRAIAVLVQKGKPTTGVINIYSTSGNSSACIVAWLAPYLNTPQDVREKVLKFAAECSLGINPETRSQFWFYFEGQQVRFPTIVNGFKWVDKKEL